MSFSNPLWNDMIIQRLLDIDKQISAINIRLDNMSNRLDNIEKHICINKIEIKDVINDIIYNKITNNDINNARNQNLNQNQNQNQNPNLNQNQNPNLNQNHSVTSEFKPNKNGSNIIKTLVPKNNNLAHFDNINFPNEVYIVTFMNNTIEEKKAIDINDYTLNDINHLLIQSSPFESPLLFEVHHCPSLSPKNIL